MLLIIAVFIAAIVFILLRLRVRRTKLGWMSEKWLAEHQASSRSI